MTNPPGAMPPLPTHEELELFAAELVRSEKLLWLGFRQDKEDRYTIPSISPSAAKLAFEFAQAYAAPLIARVAELEKDAAELSFLAQDLLYWVDRAVSKGNANSDIEEAYERYEQWQRDRAAIAAKD